MQLNLASTIIGCLAVIVNPVTAAEKSLRALTHGRNAADNEHEQQSADELWKTIPKEFLWGYGHDSPQLNPNNNGGTNIITNNINNYINDYNILSNNDNNNVMINLNVPSSEVRVPTYSPTVPKGQIPTFRPIMPTGSSADAPVFPTYKPTVPFPTWVPTPLAPGTRRRAGSTKTCN